MVHHLDALQPKGGESKTSKGSRHGFLLSPMLQGTDLARAFSVGVGSENASEGVEADGADDSCSYEGGGRDSSLS